MHLYSKLIIIYYILVYRTIKESIVIKSMIKSTIKEIKIAYMLPCCFAENIIYHTHYYYDYYYLPLRAEISFSNLIIPSFHIKYMTRRKYVLFECQGNLLN